MVELDYQERREAALIKAEAASDIMHAFANAPATSTIATQAGALKPLAYYHEKVAEVTNSVDGLVLEVADLLDTLV